MPQLEGHLIPLYWGRISPMLTSSSLNVGLGPISVKITDIRLFNDVKVFELEFILTSLSPAYAGR
jgi:hypothetical protein